MKLITYTPNIKKASDDNDNSIITMLSYKDFDMLFMADGGIKSFDNIKDDLQNENIEVLKIGHHGGTNVVSGDMLQSLNVKVGIISTGFNNFGHPKKQTLKTLSDNNLKVYRTDIDNAIKITTNGNSYSIYKYDRKTKVFIKDIDLSVNHVSDIMKNDK